MIDSRKNINGIKEANMSGKQAWNQQRERKNPTTTKRSNKIYTGKVR